jgi:hypothetical protein
MVRMADAALIDLPRLAAQRRAASPTTTESARRASTRAPLRGRIDLDGTSEESDRALAAVASVLRR